MLLASLAAGLGPETRVGMKAAGFTARPEIVMLANIYDAINMLAYGLGGGQGEKPESIAEQFIDEGEHEIDKKVETFSNGAEFEKRRNELLQKIKK